MVVSSFLSKYKFHSWDEWIKIKFYDICFWKAESFMSTKVNKQLFNCFIWYIHSSHFKTWESKKKSKFLSSEDSGSCGFYFNNILLKFVEISKTRRNWISSNIQFKYFLVYTSALGHKLFINIWLQATHYMNSPLNAHITFCMSFCWFINLYFVYILSSNNHQNVRALIHTPKVIEVR